MATTRVLLADRHAIVLEGLSSLLQASGAIEVVAQVADGLSVVRLAGELRPDVVVLNVNLPRLSGIDACARIVGGVCPECRVLMLADTVARGTVAEAMHAGASGYLGKGSSVQELRDAIHAACDGKRFLGKPVADLYLDDALLEYHGSQVLLDKLSPREREILEMVVNGLSSSVVAQLLELSPKTVDTYRSRLMAKLGVDDITSLVKFAIRTGLLKLQ